MRGAHIALRIVAVIGLALTVLVPREYQPMAQAEQRPAAPIQSTPWGNRHIIFLPGICPVGKGAPYRAFNCTAPGTRMGSEERAFSRDGFYALSEALQKAGVPFTPYFYSYPGAGVYRNLSLFNGLDSYLPEDTHHSLADDARLLDRQIREVLLDANSPNYDPLATFDLVGHGLGGVVAAYWVVAYAAPGELARVHSLITLDSPLQGMGNLAAMGPNRYFSGAVYGDLLPPICVYGVCDGSAAIARINDERQGLLAKLPRVLTLANEQDEVVPFQSSWIGTASAPWNLLSVGGCVRGDTLCHLAVLHDRSTIACAAAWVDSTTVQDATPFGLHCALSVSSHVRQLPVAPLGPHGLPVTLTRGPALTTYLSKLVHQMRGRSARPTRIAILGNIVGIRGRVLLVQQLVPQVTGARTNQLLFHDQATPIGSNGKNIAVTLNARTLVAVGGGLSLKSMGKTVIIGGTESDGAIDAQLVVSFQPNAIRRVVSANVSQTSAQAAVVTGDVVRVRSVAAGRAYLASRDDPQSKTVIFSDVHNDPASDVTWPKFTIPVNIPGCNIALTGQPEFAYSSGIDVNFPVAVQVSGQMPNAGGEPATFNVTAKPSAPTSGTTVNMGLGVAANINLSLTSCLGDFSGISVGFGAGFLYTSHNPAPMPGELDRLNTQCSITTNLIAIKGISVDLELCPEVTLQGAPLQVAGYLCSSAQPSIACPSLVPANERGGKRFNVDDTDPAILTGSALSPTSWLDFGDIEYHPSILISPRLSVDIGPISSPEYSWNTPQLVLTNGYESNPGLLGFKFDIAQKSPVPVPPTDTFTPTSTPNRPQPQVPTNTFTPTDTPEPSTQMPLPPPTSTIVPSAFTPAPPTNTPVPPPAATSAASALKISVTTNIGTYPGLNPVQVCVSVSKAAQVIITGSDDGGVYQLAAQHLNAGNTCMILSFRRTSTTVVTATGTADDGSGTASSQAIVTFPPISVVSIPTGTSTPTNPCAGQYAITLDSDWRGVPPGGSDNLRAHTNPPGCPIAAIVDATAMQEHPELNEVVVATCGASSAVECDASVSEDNGTMQYPRGNPSSVTTSTTTHTFVACADVLCVQHPASYLSSSAAVTVSWVGAPTGPSPTATASPGGGGGTCNYTGSISLAASTTTAAAGTSVQLTAQATQDIGGCYIAIFVTTGGPLKVCSGGSSCQATVGGQGYYSNTISYVAQVIAGPYIVQSPWSQTDYATSNIVSVTWGG